MSLFLRTNVNPVPDVLSCIASTPSPKGAAHVLPGTEVSPSCVKMRRDLFLSALCNLFHSNLYFYHHGT